ncbi:pilin [Glycomyces tenuis]|uniref:pilin n=1 Tax=Glycomyces tenuis TaxID=58116 RepID=UPI000554270F|nr:pilin [Glycomyces tenuis]
MNGTEVMRSRRHERRVRIASGFAAVIGGVCTLVLLVPGVALASTEQLVGVLNNLRNWIVGIAGTLVAVMLTIAGLRYLLASDPGETEKAKMALRAAAIGFAIVILAPAFVAILAAILE